MERSLNDKKIRIKQQLVLWKSGKMKKDEILEEEIFEQKKEDDEVLEEDTFERKPNYDYATPIENIKAVGEFVGDMKKIVKDGWKGSSKADKAKLLLILLPFFIGLAVGAVGVGFANIGQSFESAKLLTIGYILMGTGFGTAFLTILISIIVQAIKDRKNRW